MTILAVGANDELTRLDRARDELRRVAPDLSASTFLSRAQKRSALAALVVIGLGLALATVPTAITLIALVTAIYVVTVVHRVVLTMRSLRNPAIVRVTDADARAVPDTELPVYTYDYHSTSTSTYVGGSSGTYAETGGGYHVVPHGWVDGYGVMHTGGGAYAGVPAHYETGGRDRDRMSSWHGYDAYCPDDDR